METRKTFQGAWAISDIINGHRVEQQYMGYTKAEAIKAFKKQIKSDNTSKNCGERIGPQTQVTGIFSDLYCKNMKKGKHKISELSDAIGCQIAREYSGEKD